MRDHVPDLRSHGPARLGLRRCGRPEPYIVALLGRYCERVIEVVHLLGVHSQDGGASRHQTNPLPYDRRIYNLPSSA
jgi:hypothetical protein